MMITVEIIDLDTFQQIALIIDKKYPFFIHKFDVSIGQLKNLYYFD